MFLILLVWDEKKAVCDATAFSALCEYDSEI